MKGDFKMKFEKNKKYTTIAIYACIVILFSIVCLYFVLNVESLSSFMRILLSIISPILYGAIIAYILNSVLKFFENKVFITKEMRAARKSAKAQAQKNGITSKFKLEKIMNEAAAEAAEKSKKAKPSAKKDSVPIEKIKDFRKKKKKSTGNRALSLICTYLIFIAIIVLLFSILLPQLWDSLSSLYVNVSLMIKNLPTTITVLTAKYQWFRTIYNFIFENTELNSTGITSIIKRILDNSADIIAFLQSVIGNTITQVKNVLLGIIFSVYFLIYKEMLLGQANKILDAVAGPKAAKYTRHVFVQFDRKFGQFIQGKLLDSAIIGVLSFFVFWIFNIPYYQLIAVIIGITNMIPFFGPFIGAIPSAIIIFLVDPAKAVLFVVLILIIQQVDGNLIGPHILGSTIDLNPLWIMIAIIVMSGLFGVFGMFFGVPIFAVIYTLISEQVYKRLAVKGAKSVCEETSETDFISFLESKEIPEE